MKIFLDTSVLISASGSTKGCSYTIIHELADANRWKIITSKYCVAEVERNVRKLSEQAEKRWRNEIRRRVHIVPDALTMKFPHLLTASKDKPVLISAISAKADVLLTWDTSDFAIVLDSLVYGVHVLTPIRFLENQVI